MAWFYNYGFTVTGGSIGILNSVYGCTVSGNNVSSCLMLTMVSGFQAQITTKFMEIMYLESCYGIFPHFTFQIIYFQNTSKKYNGVS